MSPRDLAASLARVSLREWRFPIAVGAIVAVSIPCAATMASWTPLGLENQHILKIDSNGVYVFAITQDAGLYDRSLWRVRVDGTKSPELIWSSATNPSAWTVACHPLEADTVYLGINGEFGTAIPDPTLLRSVDGGATFGALDDGLCPSPSGVSDIAASATSPSLLAALPDNSPHVATSAIGSWLQLDHPCGCEQCVLTHVARGVSDEDVIWVGEPTPCFGFGLLQSDDGGQTWSSPFDECDTQLRSLIIDPVNADRVYFSTSPTEEAYRTNDGGQTWEQMSVSGTFLDIDTQDPAIVYAAGGAGVGEMSWSPAHGYIWNAIDTNGLPGTGITAFCADPMVQGLLFAAHFNAGIYKKQISVQSVGVNDPVSVPTMPKIVVMPNPFRNATTVTWRYPEASLVPHGTAGSSTFRRRSIGVFDTAGRFVRTLRVRTEMSPGGYIGVAVWDGTNDAGHSAHPGVYFIVPRGAKGARVVKLR